VSSRTHVTHDGSAAAVTVYVYLLLGSLLLGERGWVNV
jgi:hypothetical protein